MKGIILAGGRATRLYPITKGVCKQMLPVYDKPMIYYPLSVLMLAGIRRILVISTPKDTPRFKDLLGDGKELGLNFSYAVQEQPRGIAESLIVGEKFIAKDSICLILGDNIFYGHNLGSVIRRHAVLKRGSVIFGYYVKDPHRYGVIELDKKGKALSIVEKPERPKSNYAVTGLYFYDNDALRRVKMIKPSKRGELEITDLNNHYLKDGLLKVEIFSRGYAWLDTGTCDSLLDASVFIKTIEDRQGLKVGCVEEIAYRKGYIDKNRLLRQADKLNTSYGEYLRRIAKEDER